MSEKIKVSPFSFIILFMSISILSAEISHSGDRAWDSDGIQINRMQWFNGQRAYPYETVPAGSYNYAMKQFISLQSKNSYFAPQEHWICIGPTPGYMGAVISGRIAAVKYHPADLSGNTIFIGGADGGIWKTTDAGMTWTAKTDFITSLSSGALAIGQNPSGQYTNIYYGTGESHAGFNFCYYGDGFYKSADNGETWYKVNHDNLPGYPTYFSRIVVRPGHPNELLAACGTNHTNISYESGIYRSTDYGETWQTRLVPSAGLEGRVCNDVVFSPGGTRAYITGPDETSEQVYEKGVHYRISTDGGTSFGPPRDDIITLKGRSHIAISSYDSTRLYILTHTLSPCSPGSCTPNSINATLFVSNDGGFSYTKQYDFMGLNCGCFGGDAYQSWYDMFVYCSPFDHDIIYVGLINLWKSTNGGQTFFTITPTHYDQQNMDFDPNNPNHAALATDGGLYRTTDGSTWINLNDQLTLTQIYRIASSPFNPEKIAGGAQDNGIQSKFENSDDWRDILGGNDGTTVYFSQLTPDLMFGCYGNYSGGRAPTILRSTNGGATFIDQYLPPDSYWDSQNDWIPPMISFVPAGTATEHFLISRRCIIPGIQPPQVIIRFFKTTDNGVTWNKFGNGIQANESPQNLAVCWSNPNIIYLSTGSYAWPATNQKLYKSNDGGLNWFEILNNQNSEVPNRYITHIEADKSDEDAVIITLSGFNSTIPGRPGHIFRSDNGGANWLDISGSLPDIPVNDLVIIYSGTKNYVIGTDAGVLMTSDGGETWREPGPDFPHAVVTDIEYDVFTGKVRGATFGRGVWEHNLISTSANINYTLYLNSEPRGLNINNDLVIERGGKLVIPFGCLLKMREGKKIIVKDGGEIDINSESRVSFSSQNGKWGGIEIQSGGKASISNCVFSNSDIPVTLNGKGSDPVTITGCVFNEGSIIAAGRDNINISGCIFKGTSKITGTAISAVYSKIIKIINNNISNVSYSGISISNSTAEISGNIISSGNGTLPPAGISFDNSLSGLVYGNTINNFKLEIFLFNSSIKNSANAESNSDDKNLKEINTDRELTRLISIADNEKAPDALLQAELNIIELLMISPEKEGETGSHSNLIPADLPDGIKLINEKLFGKIKVEKNNNVIPHAFSLSQNYPNPFNPVTHFEFGIPAESIVTLKIYDVLGREIAVIINEKLKPGIYNALWNASNYPSGIYFYTLETGIYYDSKKMILIK